MEFGPVMSTHNNSQWSVIPVCFVLFNMRKLKHHIHSLSPDCSWIARVRAPQRCQMPPLDPSDDSTFKSNKAICLFSTLLLHIAQTIHLSPKLLFLKLLAFTLLASRVKPLAVCLFIKLWHHKELNPDITIYVNLLKQQHTTNSSHNLIHL